MGLNNGSERIRTRLIMLQNLDVSRSPASQNVSKRLLTEREAEVGPDATEFIGSPLTPSPKQRSIQKKTAFITFDWRIINL